MEAASNNRGVIAFMVIGAIILGIIGFLLLVNNGEEPLSNSDGIVMSEETATAVVDLTDNPTAVSPTEEILIEEISPTETHQNVEPTARVGLQSTDPGIVNLASGDIQLVEFFAFW